MNLHERALSVLACRVSDWFCFLKKAGVGRFVLKRISMFWPTYFIIIIYLVRRRSYHWRSIQCHWRYIEQGIHRPYCGPQQHGDWTWCRWQGSLRGKWLFVFMLLTMIRLLTHFFYQHSYPSSVVFIKLLTIPTLQSQQMVSLNASSTIVLCKLRTTMDKELGNKWVCAIDIDLPFYYYY